MNAKECWIAPDTCLQAKTHESEWIWKRRDLEELSDNATFTSLLAWERLLSLKGLNLKSRSSDQQSFWQFNSTNIGNGDTLWSLKVSFENFVNLCFFIIRVMRKINFQVCWQIVEFKPDALSPEPWRRKKYFPVWYFTSIPSSRATDSGDWKVDMIISLYFWTSFCQAQHRFPPKNDKLISSFSYLPCELEAICTMNWIIRSSSRNSYGVDHSSESQPAPARPTAAP